MVGAAGYFSAFRSRDGAPVTLKALIGEALRSDWLDALRRERHILSLLDAPGVPRALDLVEGPGAALVLEPFDGKPLRAILKNGPLPPDEAAAAALAVCRVLAGVHAAGCIHRALSPGNILFLAGGGVMLLGFGAAFRRGGCSSDALGEPDASLSWIAPEQTDGHAPSDARSDLYALGCMLHETLLGLPPFAAQDPLELLHCHLAKRPVPVNEVDPQIPEVLSDLVARLLEKAPDRRPGGGEVERALAAYLQETGQTRQTCRPGEVPGERGKAWETAEPATGCGANDFEDGARWSVSSLELAAVMKAVRAIAAATGPHSLLLSLLHVLAECAGADKAFFFDWRDGRPELQARYALCGERAGSEVLHPEEARFVTDYSEEVVRQAAAADETMRATRSTGCILCVPVMRSGKRLGLVYLENSLYCEAFSPQRVRIVELLCAQAAVSVENARLSLARKADEVKYQSLFDNAAVGILVVSVDGGVRDANPAAAKMLGYDSVEEMMASVKDVTRFFDLEPSEGEQLGDMLQRGRIIKNYELAARRRDGRALWVSASVRPVFDAKGRLASVEAMVSDITARRLAQLEIRSLNRELLNIQENERQRIARDLHDDVAQDLSSVKIGCAALMDSHPELEGEAAGLKELLQSALAKVRDLSHSLRPPNLDQFGLARSLYLYCRDFEESSGIRVDFQAAGMERLNLGFEAQIHAYRIVQEALNNIRRHAAASEALVRLVAAHPCVILRISDDGRGFDETRLAQASLEKRMGLRSLRERAKLLGGTCSIKSRSGEGTRIIVEFPCKETGND